jgi:signal transduction histidine kinase
LSRLDEDRLKPVIRPVDTAVLLRRAMSRVVPAAEDRKVTLASEIPQDIPDLMTDAQRVEQILMNLLANAIRHSPIQGTVTVEVHRNDTDVIIRVSNAGVGIPPEETERIFDIYVTNAGEESRGTGLGLPLSRRLARLLGGELRAIPSDSGGRFELQLPLTRPVAS